MTAKRSRARSLDSVATALLDLSDRLQVIESAAVIVADACDGEGEEHAWRVLRHSVCLRIAEERQALDAIRASLGTTGTRPNS